MYTRSFNDADGRVSIPNGYGGSAIKMHEESLCDPPLNCDEPCESVEAGCEAKRRSNSSLRDIFSAVGLSMPKLGTEEIIILAIAAFLLFSQNGDKECALMLIALLFIA